MRTINRRTFGRISFSVNHTLVRFEGGETPANLHELSEEGGRLTTKKSLIKVGDSVELACPNVMADDTGDEQPFWVPASILRVITRDEQDELAFQLMPSTNKLRFGLRRLLGELVFSGLDNRRLGSRLQVNRPININGIEGRLIEIGARGFKVWLLSRIEPGENVSWSFERANGETAVGKAEVVTILPTEGNAIWGYDIGLFVLPQDKSSREKLRQLVADFLGLAHPEELGQYSFTDVALSYGHHSIMR